jgi:hypothetical protein
MTMKNWSIGSFAPTRAWDCKEPHQHKWYNYNNRWEQGEPYVVSLFCHGRWCVKYLMRPCLTESSKTSRLSWKPGKLVRTGFAGLLKTCQLELKIINYYEIYSLQILIIDTINSLCNVWPFVLFKILILIYKIISYVLIFFSDKSNHNNIYDNY